MTYDDDFIQVEFPGGAVRRARCKASGIEWPPPEEFDWQGGRVRRVSMSKLTDEQRAGMTHVCRGALYHPVSVNGEGTAP